MTEQKFIKYCPQHKDYKALKPPKCSCETCWALYLYSHFGKDKYMTQHDLEVIDKLFNRVLGFSKMNHVDGVDHR